MILYIFAAIGGFVLGIWFLIACMTWYLTWTDKRDLIAMQKKIKGWENGKA